ncbi:MAG: hypothetical protein AB4352_26185 [Hormoscilla sp.]
MLWEQGFEPLPAGALFPPRCTTLLQYYYSPKIVAIETEYFLVGFNSDLAPFSTVGGAEIIRSQAPAWERG